MTYARRVPLTNVDAARDPRRVACSPITQFVSALAYRNTEDNDASDPPCETHVITTHQSL